MNVGKSVLVTAAILLVTSGCFKTTGSGEDSKNFFNKQPVFHLPYDPGETKEANQRKERLSRSCIEKINTSRVAQNAQPIKLVIMTDKDAESEGVKNTAKATGATAAIMAGVVFMPIAAAVGGGAYLWNQNERPVSVTETQSISNCVSKRVQKDRW